MEQFVAGRGLLPQPLATYECWHEVDRTEHGLSSKRTMIGTSLLRLCERPPFGVRLRQTVFSGLFIAAFAFGTWRQNVAAAWLMTLDGANVLMVGLVLLSSNH
jgi:Transmembrane secretion effector